ncbi:MAG: DUF211 domain-containing protein [Methanolobus sp.]|nr:DUF211 domain-containing protein [Methanolobus sp.]
MFEKRYHAKLFKMELYLRNVRSKTLSILPGVHGVNLSLYEVDQQTETVKITVEGENLVYEDLKQSIENLGAVIHSIDEIAAGKRLVEEVETLQER